MPSVKVGTKAVIAAALFADSGLATPSIAPLPKRSGCLDTFFSTAYPMNDAIAAPVPGNAPRTEPMPPPLITGKKLRLTSARDGKRLFRFNEYAVDWEGLLILLITSEIPNTPIARTTILIPSMRGTAPKSNLDTPEATSLPTVPNSIPTTTMANVLATEP